MSLNAVQQFLKQTLDGLPSPYLPPAAARVAPPQQDDIGAPKLYIWGSTFTDIIHTMGRARFTANNDMIIGTGGNRERDYEVRVWVVCAMAADDPHIDSAFPCLIDAVLNAVTAVIPSIIITDPDTQVQTALSSIGDRFSVEYSPAHTLIDQRYIRLDATITCSIKELSGT